MKEQYEQPKCTIIEFETQDIITASGPNELPWDPLTSSYDENYLDY